MAVKSGIKNISKTLRIMRYHIKHHQQAKRIMKTLSSEGKTLRASDKRKVDRYAVEVLGSNIYSPWLYVYSTVSGQYKDGWIPDNYYGQKIVPQMKGAYGNVSDLNNIQRKVFPSDAFPDKGGFANGLFFDEDEKVLNVNQVKDYFFSQDKLIVYKTDSSLQGRGVHFFNQEDFNANDIPSLGNGVFQKYVEQHSFLSAFGSRAVGTIRLTSVIKPDGEAKIAAAYLRLGAASDRHVKSSSHIRIPLDIENGQLGEIGMLADWSSVRYHPASGREFTGTIPSYEDAVNLVLKLHRNLPYVRSIGWDITIGAEGDVFIMEWNGAHNDIKFSEATQGPCFSGLGWLG